MKISGSDTLERTPGQIISQNVFTLFNLLNVIIAVMLLLVHAYSNMAFLAIIILNTLIGIVQELKARKQVEKLRILNRPIATVLRNGEAVEVPADLLNVGDVTVLESGRQICADAEILEGTIEVNESLLTGESDAVIHRPGDTLLSGSTVICGKCLARVLHTGEDNYAGALEHAVRREKPVSSELLDSMRRVTHFTSFLIPVLGLALLAEALLLRGADPRSAVISVSAALLGMLPKGLVLLISVSLAMGSARLAKKKILVQNMYSLENFAHADVLCLDKTGTLTSGDLHVNRVLPLCRDPEKGSRLMESFLAASEDNNATAGALREYFHLTDSLPVTEKGKRNLSASVTGKIPFSSARKWSSISLHGIGTVFLGSPEKLLSRTLPEEETALCEGNRVLAAGLYPEFWDDRTKLPPVQEILPLFLFILSDVIRPNAERTLHYFCKQGMSVKIISGDHPVTVSRTAQRAGVPCWDHVIDLSKVSEEEDYTALCEKYTVFARVSPRQKQLLVSSLQKLGHKVAMTGDGVNDLLALREADCSIAVAQGSESSRQVAQIVLMDSDFTYLPEVLEEGRRVIHNVTRTAGVFFIKTVYSLLLSVICLLSGMEFPFIPIQITLIDACIEAFPSFACTLEKQSGRIRGTFLSCAFGNALPYALCIVSGVLFLKLYAPLSGDALQTAQYLLLILLSWLAVVHSCRPFTLFRAAVCILSAAALLGAFLLVPSLLELAPLNPPMMLMFALTAFLSCVLLLLLQRIRKILSAQERQ